MSKFFIWFTKITAFPIEALIFRTKVYYEDRRVQGCRIKGGAVVISNHTSLYDFAILLFLFFTRTIRTLMAEVLYRGALGKFITLLGGIRVDRNAFDFSFVPTSVETIEKGGVVAVFPEARLPLPEEERPLPFKPSAAYIALESGAPVIPIYTNGSYFKWKRARVIVGKPIDARSLIDPEKSERENIETVNNAFREKIVELGRLLDEKTNRR